MDFSEALNHVKAGMCASRHQEDAPTWWISLTPGRRVEADQFWSPANRLFAERCGGSALVKSYITMKTADGLIVPWTATQSDLLAEDWYIVQGMHGGS